jgi:hypothetical protein
LALAADHQHCCLTGKDQQTQFLNRPKENHPPQNQKLVFLVQLITQPRLKQFFLTIIDLNRLHDFLLLNFTEFICQKMNGDTPISGKSMVGESVVEASRKWVGEVFQDGRIRVAIVELKIPPITGLSVLAKYTKVLWT